TQSEPTPLRQYTRRVRIAQSSALPPVADDPASPVRDVSEGEACPNDSGFIADQDRATIAKSSTLPHDTAPRVTSITAVEGNVSEGEACPTDSGFIADQDRATIAKSSTLPHDTAPRVTSIAAVEGKDNQGVIGARSADDAPIKGMRIDEEEGITRRDSSDTKEIRMDEGELAVERTSEDTEEMATVLTSIDATTVLAGGIDVPNGSYSIPTAGPLLLTFTMAVMLFPLLVRLLPLPLLLPLIQEEREKKLWWSLTLQRNREVARIHAEEELQGMIDSLDRTNETIDKYLDAEVARIHAEEELQGMIDSLDRTNETIDKYL
nr:hypothetical protein [Tanacetum cinerariifolium]